MNCSLLHTLFTCTLIFARWCGNDCYVRWTGAAGRSADHYFGPPFFFFLSATPHYFHLICSHLFPSDVPAILKLRTHHALAISSSISCTSVSHLSIGPHDATCRTSLPSSSGSPTRAGIPSWRRSGRSGRSGRVGRCWPMLAGGTCHDGTMPRWFHDVP